jgi:hypothetical protein
MGSRLRGWLSALLVSGVALGGLSAVAFPEVSAAAAAAVVGGAGVDRVGVSPAAVPVVVPPGPEGVQVTKPSSPVFPGPAQAQVSVPVSGAVVPVADSVVAVGGLRDKAGVLEPGGVNVQVLDRDTARKTLIDSAAVGVKLTPSVAGATSVDVRVDYSKFADAYGAGYASRLRLYSLPACFAVTPDVEGCGPVKLDSSHNLDARVIDTSVPITSDALAPLPPGGAATPTPSASASAAAQAPAVDGAEVGSATVFLAAGADSSAGDFKATPTPTAASWDVGLNSGNFHYDYPLPSPPTVGGAVPSMALSYDSQTVDGRTSESNGQVSWAGQGWDLQSGFIERKYRSCDMDGQDGKADLCWGGSPYVINLNGQSHDLIPIQGTNFSQFRLRDDAGWQVNLLTTGHNGDNNNEYFEVRDPGTAKKLRLFSPDSDGYLMA